MALGVRNWLKANWTGGRKDCAPRRVLRVARGVGHMKLEKKCTLRTLSPLTPADPSGSFSPLTPALPTNRPLTPALSPLPRKLSGFRGEGEGRKVHGLNLRQNILKFPLLRGISRSRPTCRRINS